MQCPPYCREQTSNGEGGMSALAQYASGPKQALDPAIWYAPDGRNEHIDGERGWRAKEGEREGHDVEEQRHEPLAVSAQRDCQVRLATVVCNQQPREDVVRNAAHKEHHPIERNRQGLKMVLAHPP